MCTYDNKAVAPLNENNIRECRRGYQKCIIQRNWQQDEDKQNKAF